MQKAPFFLSAMIKYLSSKRLVVLAAVVALAYALIFFNAFAGDSLMYHLPFAARFWRLENWPDYQGYFEFRYQGFPVLWRVFLGPGMMLHAPRLLFIPNLIALFMLCWSARTHLKLHWAVTIVAVLSIPVVLYGFASSMQDFFVNACAVAGAISIFSYQGNSTSRPAETLVPGLLMLALAANVKTQGLILATLVLAVGASSLIGQFGLSRVFWIIRSFFGGRLFTPSRSIATRFLPAILICLIYAQPMANTWRFGNPLYPVQFAAFKGQETSYVSNLPYLPKIPLIYNALSFIASSTEIDPIIRSKPGLFFLRSVHMQNKPVSPDQPADPYGNRWILTGGSNGLLFIFIVVIAAYTSFFGGGRLAIPSGGDIRLLQRRLIISCIICTLVPQSLELRYYMYLLIVPALVAVSSHSAILCNLARIAVIAGLIYSLIISLTLPAYFMMRTSTWPPDSVSWDPLRHRPSQSSCETFKAQYAVEKQMSKIEHGTVQQTIICGF